MFSLHGHGVEEDHAHEEEEEDREYLWKACVVLAGIYVFYLLELFLHGLTDHLKKVRSLSQLARDQTVQWNLSIVVTVCL